MLGKPFQLVLRALILDEQGRILLMQRSAKSLNQPGTWELPGGKPDLGEDVSAALRREIKEETGFDVELLDVIGHSQWEKETVRMAYLIFSVRIISGEFVLSFEHDDYQWVEKNRVLTFDLSPQMKTFFEGYLSC